MRQERNQSHDLKQGSADRDVTGSKQGMPGAREAGAKVPDKPRHCGPNVDTWPILDEPAGDAPKPKTGAAAKPGPSS